MKSERDLLKKDNKELRKYRKQCVYVGFHETTNIWSEKNRPFGGKFTDFSWFQHKIYLFSLF